LFDNLYSVVAVAGSLSQKKFSQQQQQQPQCVLKKQVILAPPSTAAIAALSPFPGAHPHARQVFLSVKK
jgi:hypothetical protein